MNTPLTTEEKNIIKDILKAIGRDDELDIQFANAVGLTVTKFDAACDSIFRKCGNGRLTVEE